MQTRQVISNGAALAVIVAVVAVIVTTRWIFQLPILSWQTLGWSVILFLLVCPLGLRFERKK